MPRIGIVGGTFNPVHYGHLIAAEEARESLGLDKVLFVPNFVPPHKESSSLASGGERMDMLRLALAGNPSFESSSIELDRGGVSYTIDTVRELIAGNGEGRFTFISGADAVLTSKWRDFDGLLALLESFVAVSRPGYSFDDLRERVSVFSNRDKFVFLEIPGGAYSSTDIRKRVAEGRSIRYLVPDPVREYILSNGLYRPLD